MEWSLLVVVSGGLLWLGNEVSKLRRDFAAFHVTVIEILERPYVERQRKHELKRLHIELQREIEKANAIAAKINNKASESSAGQPAPPKG